MSKFKTAVSVLLAIVVVISLVHSAYSYDPSEHSLYPSETTGAVIGAILVLVLIANVLLRLFGSRKLVVYFGMLIAIIASFFLLSTFGMLLTKVKIAGPLMYGASILICLLLIVSGMLGCISA